MSRPTVRTFILSLFLGGVSSTAGAQDARPNREPPVLGSSIGTDWLADLPLGSTIGSLLDTSVPEVISERIDAGCASATVPRGRRRGFAWATSMSPSR